MSGLSLGFYVWLVRSNSHSKYRYLDAYNFSTTLNAILEFHCKESWQVWIIIKYFYLNQMTLQAMDWRGRTVTRIRLWIICFSMVKLMWIQRSMQSFPPNKFTCYRRSYFSLKPTFFSSSCFLYSFFYLGTVLVFGLTSIEKPVVSLKWKKQFNFQNTRPSQHNGLHKMYE